jgi:hypothetical protein
MTSIILMQLPLDYRWSFEKRPLDVRRVQERGISRKARAVHVRAKRAAFPAQRVGRTLRVEAAQALEVRDNPAQVAAQRFALFGREPDGRKRRKLAYERIVNPRLRAFFPQNVPPVT